MIRYNLLIVLMLYCKSFNRGKRRVNSVIINATAAVFTCRYFSNTSTMNHKLVVVQDT